MGLDGTGGGFVFGLTIGFRLGVKGGGGVFGSDGGVFGSGGGVFGSGGGVFTLIEGNSLRSSKSIGGGGGTFMISSSVKRGVSSGGGGEIGLLNTSGGTNKGTLLLKWVVVATG